MNFAVGSLVKSRGREWVVLPDSSEEFLLLRPLGGTEDEVTGICTEIEEVQPATFHLPNPADIGDYRSCRLLRDAVRLGFRSSAGPFRSVAKIAVEPRPYQFVPLLLALKLDPIRMLIADDVGIGKTIEASLIARELLDRGECRRLAVLCPPHLAEQWQGELRNKFHIEAELVLTSTARHLEKGLGVGKSIFDVYPFTIVSTDLIKSDRHRDDFLRSCPELVLVDEAHAFAYGYAGRGGRHQRHELLTGLASNPERHLILVTATPHSGKEEAFRSLLGFLNMDFLEFPEDLSGPENEKHRRHLAQHFIQRRRADIADYLGTETIFPDRIEDEETYHLTEEYKKLFARVLRYARETVSDKKVGGHHQRVRWWSALALLRSLASSPAAAAATLRTRASAADTETPESADEIGRKTILDQGDEDIEETLDSTPGSDIGEFAENESSHRKRLLDMARQAEALEGKSDQKLQTAAKMIKAMVKDGHRPMIFCRFISTAEYVAEQLKELLPKKVEVTAITGKIPPAEREERVLQLADSNQRVLVCTDCLSEGINLQEWFDSVFHYDLSWNPTRLEQREGRVDRFGQPEKTVQVVTYWGTDNQIDGIVLDVLLRKHKKIRSSLGISVPVPADTNKVVEAIFEGLLLREESEASDTVQQYLPGFEDLLKPVKKDLDDKLELSANREKKSKTMFAQQTIKVDEVAREWQAVREAIGTSIDVEQFTVEAIKAHGGFVRKNGVYQFDLGEAPGSLKEAVQNREKFKARFSMPVSDKELYLNRTHPVVEGLAAHVMDTALDAVLSSVANRAGVIRTKKVKTRTTLLLVRFRFHILTRKRGEEYPLLAEDCHLVAFEGAPDNPQWIEDKEAIEELLGAEPEENIGSDQARQFVQKVITGMDSIHSHLDEVAEQRGKELLDQHGRVRTAANVKGIRYRVEPKLPPDILGIYVYLPV
jgi:superfamily II DNA or RNA helicase